MKTFYEYLSALALLSRLRLVETYFTFDPAQYNQLFDDELHKLSASSPEHRDALERMRHFNWIGYIAKSLRNAGYRDQREVAEATHDIVVKLLMGGCSGITTSGGMVLWTCGSNGPWRTRSKTWPRRTGTGDDSCPPFPSTRILGGRDDLPDRMRMTTEDDERLIDDFRRLVGQRLGKLGRAVLDARMDGEEMKSLVGREDLGSPGRFQVKAIVQKVKALAREYAQRLGDSGFLRDVERAFEREEETVQKRLATGARRREFSQV